jgi:3-phenylpropionate/trans-cinnamate dioxygenase ferredoxin reductase subunit
VTPVAANQTFVIVGASLAGAKAAEALREEGFDGQIVLIGDEGERPYERPPLSKDYLMGRSEKDKIYVHPQQWYAEHDVDLRLQTRVTAIDPAGHRVSTDRGDPVGYDKLLLATGSSPRLLGVPGADPHRVFYLRRVEDCEQLKVTLRTASRVVVIGAGWIGLEVAAAARTLGVEVSLLETAELPLLRVLGRELGEVFAGLHRDHGVGLRFGVQVVEITGQAKRASGVRLADGIHVDADLVVVGVGVTPNTELAEAAGVAVDNGITVDEHLRSSDPDIYAAGDVANAFHPSLGKHIRVEHWANALNQPPIAARGMLGHDAVYDKPPYFFSDQYDLGMEYSGYVEPHGYDEVIFRGDVGKREFLAFWVKDRTVLAGMNANIWDVTDTIQSLVTSGRLVDTTKLANPDVPLTQVYSEAPDQAPPATQEPA